MCQFFFTWVCRPYFVAGMAVVDEAANQAAAHVAGANKGNDWLYHCDDFPAEKLK
jgi:hypothetical protein